MIRPRVTISQGTVDKIIAQTRTQARPKARAELEAFGTEWEVKVREIVQAELPRRDGVRHKTNTTHLENSFQARVVEGPNGGFPMRLELTTKPGVNAKKIAALEFGIKGTHPITAKRTKYLRWGDVPGDLEGSGFKTVTWRSDGPNAHGKIQGGYHFMERARDAVLARRRRRG